MPNKPLTSTQIDRLRNFKGYGNPKGGFWFIGMEEGAGGSIDELEMRAREFQEIEDLDRAQKLINPHVDRRKLQTSTWTSMCRIVGHLAGDKQWHEVSHVREYQALRLGRLDGETFLTEVLPLPKPGRSSWPFGELWDTEDAYVEAVLGDRLEMLSQLHSESKPRYTFCYGKGFWDHHKAIFWDREFRPLIEDDAEISVAGKSVIVLTRFFDPSYQGFTIDFIDRLCTKIKHELGSPIGTKA